MPFCICFSSVNTCEHVILDIRVCAGWLCEGVTGGIPVRGSIDREMDCPRCSWKPREATVLFFLLERSPVTNGFILGRWGCVVLLTAVQPPGAHGPALPSSFSSSASSYSSLFNLALLWDGTEQRNARSVWNATSCQLLTSDELPVAHCKILLS